MSRNIKGSFNTRRDADMAVERLVQEYGIERTDIFLAPVGAENSSGMAVAGSDAASGSPDSRPRRDGAHAGAVDVSVDVNDDNVGSKIIATFEEFGALVQVDAS